MNSSWHERSWLIFLAAGTVAMSVLPFVANDYVVGTGLTLLMWLALTQSWCVLSKMTGYISLGHVVFYGLAPTWWWSPGSRCRWCSRCSRRA